MRIDRSVWPGKHALVLALGGLLAVSPALAHDREHEKEHGRGHEREHDNDHGKDHGKEHDQQLSPARVARMVERALPDWGPDVLDVPDGQRWAEDVGFDRLLLALADDDPLPRDLPEGARQLREEERSIRLDPEQGKLRYVNRKRAWSFDRDFPTPAYDPGKAAARVMEVARSLGAPLDEAELPAVQTQMGAGGPSGSPRATETFEMYRLVRFSRRVGKLPVFGSGFAAAVSHDGMVERLQVSWPTFSLAASLRLRSRSGVVDDAVRQILNQDPGRDTTLMAQLVYAPQEDEKKVLRYLPAVQIAVRSEPTPYFVMVPVAEEAGQDETP
jgi:hypothetical protein